MKYLDEYLDADATRRPSEKTEQDFTFEHAARADAVAAAATIPPSKDLRAAWWKIRMFLRRDTKEK